MLCQDWQATHGLGTEALGTLQDGLSELAGADEREGVLAAAKLLLNKVRSLQYSAASRNEQAQSWLCWSFSTSSTLCNQLPSFLSCSTLHKQRRWQCHATQAPSPGSAAFIERGGAPRCDAGVTARLSAAMATLDDTRERLRLLLERFLLAAGKLEQVCPAAQASCTACPLLACQMLNAPLSLGLQPWPC